MKISIAVVGALVLAGCASKNLQLSPIGGSKADAMVVLAAETGGMGTPTFDVAHNNAEAARACMNWGFWSADMMPGYQYRCGQYTCEYRVRYQCIQR